MFEFLVRQENTIFFLVEKVSNTQVTQNIFWSKSFKSNSFCNVT